MTALVDEFANAREKSAVTDPQKVQLYSQLGDLYASLGLHQQAEPWLTKVVTLAPRTYPVLARTLASLSRHDQALQLCLDHKPDKLSPEFMNNVLVVLTTNNPPETVFAQAESLLQQAIADNNDDADVLFALGTIRAVQAQYPQSLELFLRANQLRPGNVLTLNNLATLLAELPGREAEGLPYVDQAIQIAGDQPFLLDTKGILLIRTGDVQQAVTCLRQAVTGTAVDPRFYLHLAAACDRSGQAVEARQALDKALSGGLELTILTDSDRAMLDLLRSKLASSKP